MSDAKESPSPSAGTAAAAVEGIRETAKWAIAAFAAIGAALAAGTQFSSIGSVQDPVRVGTAGAAAVLGLVAVLYAIWRTVDVLLPGAISPKDLVRLENYFGRTGLWKYLRSDPDKSLGDFLRDNRDLLRGKATTVADLKRQLDTTILARDQAYDAAEATGATKEQEALAIAKDSDVRYLGAIQQDLLAEASVARLSIAMGRWRRDTTTAVVVAAVCLLYFAWAANPPKATTPTVSMAGSDLSNANLAGANLSGVDLRGANLTGANLRGASLKEAKLDGVIWTGATCPDGMPVAQEGGACRP
jgi:hypothetical protein